MTRGLWQVFEFYMRTRVHCQRSGSGNAAIAVLSHDTSNRIQVTLQAKLTSEDVIDGRAVSVVDEWINTRGGKRVLDIDLSYKEAVLLHGVLEDAIRDAKARQKLQHMLGQDASSIDSIILEDDYKVH